MISIDSIGAQLYTVRDFCKTEDDLKLTLEKVAKTGYKSVQVSGVAVDDAKFIKKTADDNGLKIVATHFSYEEMADGIEEIIEKHRIYDCKYVGISSMPKELRTTKEGFLSFAKDANRFGETFKKAGFSLVYHNHAFEFAKFDNKRGIDILIDETDRELVQFEIDTYWVQVGGSSPADYIERLRGRIDVIHFKDMYPRDNAPVMTEIGNGNIDFVKILGICDKSNVKHILVEQDRCERDPFESLKISYDYLKSVSGGN
ncbi:MAG: Inosose dehydratase [Firmicutes bacterium ADurb.Bin193]|nr:MAG: Inosose dehydratase [Firmicutes bacterium ADurb.Bin193]